MRIIIQYYLGILFHVILLNDEIVIKRIFELKLRCHPIKRKMKGKLSRKLKLIYRQDKISTFLFTLGIADGLLGGFSQQWTLFSLGIFVVMMGLFLRWLQLEKSKKVNLLARSNKYLPPSRHNLQPLPTLQRKRDFRENKG